MVGLIGGLIVVAILAVIFIPIFASKKFLNDDSIDKVKKIEIRNAWRSITAQIIGGATVLAGLYSTIDNLKVSNENLSIAQKSSITNRLAKGIELLASDKKEIRIGGAFTLESVMQESKDTYSVIKEIFIGFLEEHSSTTNLSAVKKGIRLDFQDVQSVLTILGRRHHDDTLIFRSLYLCDAIFDGAELQNTIFVGADLYGASFVNANLQGVVFGKLTGQKYEDGNDKGGAQITNANFTGANLSYADFTYAGGYNCKQLLPVKTLFRAKLPQHVKDSIEFFFNRPELLQETK